MMAEWEDHRLHLENALSRVDEQIADTIHHLIVLGREQAIIQQMIEVEYVQTDQTVPVPRSDSQPLPAEAPVHLD